MSLTRFLVRSIQSLRQVVNDVVWGFQANGHAQA